MNKYLISADIEGISGVIDKTFANKAGSHYELARKYMHSDINAVVSGIINQDPDAYVLVRDAHSDAINLDLEKLHPKASLIQGWGNALNMLEGLDHSFKGVFLVGYHAGGHNSEAVLAHTMSTQIHSLKINNQLMNETGIAAIYAGMFEVPVGFISGDDYVVAEANEQLGNVVGVVVKKSLARDSAISLSLTEARCALEKGASLAVKNILERKVSPLKINPPYALELKLYHIGYKISVFERMTETLGFDSNYVFDVTNFTIKYTANSANEMLQRLNLLIQLIYYFNKFL